MGRLIWRASRSEARQGCVSNTTRYVSLMGRPFVWLSATCSPLYLASSYMFQYTQLDLLLTFKYVHGPRTRGDELVVVCCRELGFGEVTPPNVMPTLPGPEAAGADSHRHYSLPPDEFPMASVSCTQGLCLRLMFPTSLRPRCDFPSEQVARAGYSSAPQFRVLAPKL